MFGSLANAEREYPLLPKPPKPSRKLKPLGKPKSKPLPKRPAK